MAVSISERIKQDALASLPLPLKRKLRLKDEWLQLAFEEYFAELNDLMAKVARLDAQIKMMAETSDIKDDVEKLICFTGIDYLTAVSIVVEVGDFSRFSNAKMLIWQ